MTKVRLATREDLSRIFEIEQEAMSPPWSYVAFEEELGRDDSFFVAAMSNTTEPSPCVIAMNNTTNLSPCVCGYAIMRKVGDDGELLKIVVEKSSRGNGIGDLLMESVLDHTEENGFKAVFLEVRVGNIAATRLYEKHGFKSVRIRKEYYNAPFEDALIMVRGDMW